MKGNYAILFGDIVDFSQLVNSVGDKKEELKSRHKSTIYSLAEKFNGELLDFFTDSTKIVFHKPANAVRFAKEVIKKFSLEPRVPYRVSISFGFAEYDSTGIYGKQAQIASRLIHLCPEGSIIFTKDFADKIQTEKDFHVQYIGNTLLKGIESPTEIYCLASNGMYVPTQMELSEKKRNKNSIAVLPFHNTSSERELDYICDGLAEEIIDSLTKKQGLFVTARSSSFMFKNKNVSILEISKKLNVGYVLDGSIRKRHDEYRISYQLVDSLTGFNIISDSISTDFDNLYNTEKTIVKSIVGQFDLENKENEAPEEYYIDPTAYSYYLKGRHLTYQWTPETAKEAIAQFNKALEIVPNYALAYAGLSVCYTHSAINQFLDYIPSIQKAVEYADKAIEEDGKIHDGFVSKALATFWMGNWYVPDFEDNLTKALMISPCNAEIRMFNGMLFLFKGDMKKSLSELLLAKQLDPYSTAVNIRLGLVQYLNREYEDAYNTFLSISNVEGYSTYISIRLAWCCMMLKQYDRAIYYLDSTKPDYDYYNMILGAYLVVYFNQKNEEQYYQYKTKIEQLPETDITYFYNHALLNKLSGNTELSITFLEKTLQNKLTLFMFPQFDEFWEEFHELPSFQRVIDIAYNTGKSRQLKIESETKEFIELNSADFLYAEAQDNYTLIVFKDNKKVCEKILRATLSYIENQLESSDIIRCHRSYLFNSKSEYQLRKADNKALLQHKSLDIQIPVSRSKEKEVREVMGRE